MNNFTLTGVEERDVLDFDPWGDRDATYRVIREGFCVAIFAHQCAICFGAVKPSERHWYRVETDDGKCRTFRFCPECCWCIAHRYDEWGAEDNDGWSRMDDRWEIGRKRAEAVGAMSAETPPTATCEKNGHIIGHEGRCIFCHALKEAGPHGPVNERFMQHHYGASGTSLPPASPDVGRRDAARYLRELADRLLDYPTDNYKEAYEALIACAEEEEVRATPPT